MGDAFGSGTGGFGGVFGGGSGPFGKGFGDGFPSAAGIFEAVDQLRTAFDKRVGVRMGRGDVRAAVLALLAEQPMHGYQIITEISERSHGAWKPSAGSVYPTLQLLSDEGLITATESNGRKTYALTETGRIVADEAAGTPPWESTGLKDSARVSGLPRAGMELAQVAAQVARSGSSAQVDEAIAVLDEARRRLYSILAQD
jgi:DNA-binding PadR family transcriptional regulator